MGPRRARYVGIDIEQVLVLVMGLYLRDPADVLPLRIFGTTNEAIRPPLGLSGPAAASCGIWKVGVGDGLRRAIPALEQLERETEQIRRGQGAPSLLQGPDEDL